MVSGHLVAAALLCAGVLACAAPGGVLGPVGAARGEKYFTAKCNSCHPGAGKGTGPALLGKTLPGPLKKNAASVGHNVPDVEWESLFLYLAPIMHPIVPAPELAPAPPAVAPAPDR